MPTFQDDPVVSHTTTPDGAAVSGESTTGEGVRGTSHHAKVAVVGVNDWTPDAEGDGGNGGWFESARGEGVRGWAKTPHHAGVVGVNTAGGWGVYGRGENGTGVVGESAGNVAGVFGTSKDGPGVHGKGAPAGLFDGDIVVTGNAVIKGDCILDGADYAEALTVADPAVTAGMVVVLDDDGNLRPCTGDHDPRLAGVISGACGVRPALVLDRDNGGAPLALIGKVWTLADADAGPIRPGDLLTSSTRSGHAQRVTDPSRALGALLGKALTGLEHGQGMVRVLVNHS